MAEARLIGTGRSADVFEHGPGEVLRRYREGRDTELEVAAMEGIEGAPADADLHGTSTGAS